MNIGFVVNNLGNSELTYDLIKEINNNSDVSSNIFFQNHLPPIIIPECLSMNISGLSGFRGKAVAFDLQSAAIIDETNCKTENILYLYNLEWLHNIINYKLCLDLLNKFKIYARSQSHKAVIENFTGRKDVEVVQSIKELFECLI